MYKAAALLMLVAFVSYFANSTDTDYGLAEKQAAVVRIASGAAEPRNPTARSKVKAQPDVRVEAAVGASPAPASGNDRTSVSPIASISGDLKTEMLVKSIKTELTRVGCYKGDIDANWNAETRRAMLLFNTHIESTLQVEKPDYILLTLLRGQSYVGCGKPCPAGVGGAAPLDCAAITTAALADPRIFGPPAPPPVTSRATTKAPAPPVRAAQRRPANPSGAGKATVTVARQARPVVRAVQRAEPVTRTARTSSPRQESSGSLHERIFSHISLNAP